MLRRLFLPISILFLASFSAPCETVTFNGDWSREWKLTAGDTLEISLGIAAPEALPPNARIEVRWTGPRLESYSGERGDLTAKASADWSKSLHALDPDVHLVYRAPVAGTYRLSLANAAGGVAPIVYQRDSGLALLATPPAEGAPLRGAVGMNVDVRPLDALAAGDVMLEAEPNNTPEQAVTVPFASGDADQVLRVIGSADELEYFNNGRSGAGPDDWFKIVYRGSRPKVLSANLQLVEPTISARMRVYKPGEPTAEELSPTAPPSREDFGNANPVPYVHPGAEIIPGPEQIYTYYEGRDINERIHQQDDNFRSFLTRTMQPGGTYYLRVEANQPGYELELRLFDGAPYSDPKEAVAQSIYYQLAEVDAWLIHRPRNIAVHQRVRDGSSLFGESCMSCHTQSGVWGVADAFRNGYRPEGTVQNHRRLINTMYESLRPTIKLEDAASNTSLAPNDLGDAPAGSRVAGRNIVLHERTFKPKKLHSYQQRRTANYVLLTADPQGINAAGRGSNFGPNVVFKFAVEILDRAWKDTGEERYFRGIEEKARKIVETGDDQLKVVDDLGHRIEFFQELFPKRAQYLDIVGRLSNQDAEQLQQATAFYDSFEQQVEKDIARLLSLQQENGGWGFDLGVKNGDEWTRLDEEPDAAPTAVSLNALRAAGYKTNDAPVQLGVQWLLGNQFAYGLWNKAAQTGFVTNAYVIRALSRLFPGDAVPFERRDFEPRPNETFLQEMSRVRALEKTNRADFADLMVAAAKSEYSQIRRHAYLGLGGALAPEGVATLVEGMNDPVKTAREAAFWSLRQLLLDDSGWQAAFEAYRAGDARTRQSVLQALVTRADLTGSGSSVGPQELARLLTEAMEDAHPGVRAFAFKAAWRWWVWNPGGREIINKAWAEHLLKPEPNADAEAALRYSTASMLIVNGQIANQTGGDNVDQQYPELSQLYGLIDELRAQAQPADRRRLERRLTAVAATQLPRARQ